MKKHETTRSGEILSHFVQATSKQPGAIGIFQVYGDETALTASLDLKVGGKKNNRQGNQMVEKELRYGWLRDAQGGCLDEVMLAKPAKGVRTLMTHGGIAITTAVSEYLRACCFDEITEYSRQEDSLVKIDTLFLPILASCVTETQAAAVLEAMARSKETGGALSLPTDILTTRRLLLVGAPNAGKSSLLNHLVGYDRAFVHHEAGATRDVVEELIDLGGYSVMVGDLPGYAGSRDDLAGEAWERAVRRLHDADAILFVVDASVPWNDTTGQAAAAVTEGRDNVRTLVVLNKADLPERISGTPWRRYFPHVEAVRVSSLPDGDALEVLAAQSDKLFSRQYL